MPNYEEYADMAESLASRGRHGDTILMHVNPLEVEAIERVVGRPATVNPDTGLAEGFAWFIPLIMAAVGAGVGAATSDKKKRGQGALKGALLGGLGGLAGGALAPAAGGAGAAGAAGGGAGGAGGAGALTSAALPSLTSAAAPALTSTTLGAGVMGPATAEGAAMASQLASMGISAPTVTGVPASQAALGLGSTAAPTPLITPGLEMGGMGVDVLGGGATSLGPQGLPLYPGSEQIMAGGAPEFLAAPEAAAAPESGSFLGGIGKYMKENPIVPLGGLYALSQFGGKGDGYDPFSGESAHEGDPSWADRERQLEEEERLFGGGLGSYGHGAEHDFYA